MKNNKLVVLMGCFVILLLAIPAKCAPLTNTLSTNVLPMEVVRAAEACFGEIHSNISVALAEPKRSKNVSSRHLDTLLMVISASKVALVNEQIEKKLTNALASIELLRPDLESAREKLQDPTNKELVNKLNSLEWKRRLEREQQLYEILFNELVRLQRILSELKEWAIVAEKVAPPAELTLVLRERTDKLLGDWKQIVITEPTKPQHVSERSRSAPVVGRR
jgi:hypothetical protein